VGQTLRSVLQLVDSLTSLQVQQQSCGLVVILQAHIAVVNWTDTVQHKQKRGNMTRKDFVLIAETIKQLPSFDVPADSDVVRFSALVARFADALATTNPRFNRARFEKACNGKDGR
jgi:hypothetical protein